MISVEFIALVVGLLNGGILLVRPISRFHARLDVLEAQQRELARGIDNLERLWQDRLS